MGIQESLVSTAINLASDIKADAILALTESGKSYELLSNQAGDLKVIAATPNEDIAENLEKEYGRKVIKLLVRDRDRMDQIRHAVWKGLRENIFSPGELLVCLAGSMGSPGGTDTISVYEVSKSEYTLAEIVESDLAMKSVVEIATELGRGRGGEPLGTAFMIGDSEKVLKLSHQLGVNPYKGHESISALDRRNWEMIKRFAFLDGAFILDRDGYLVAAGRYLDADVEVDIPSGLGTRHIAVASMTAATHSKGVAVSGEDGTIRVFEDGKILAKVDPNSRILREFLGS
ncbi:hypothetical protein AKJ47_02700 [candidate division MSBL1 archaeon SCGC-AAA261G05]|uniref:Diadenylate cyclase n=2 Tax=candidate division MSBL1 TaxID=215777 RepID=A0A133UYS1_9EURY|nr:hypothetical protein AKJ42_03365 [candidate division MSBL1 archaeon SCGC-AAA261C02]KXB03197.1 hypothetical protein AKJ47_02700 [candidate division MSBL1 archaeon SCGC-AAA261G05]